MICLATATSILLTGRDITQWIADSPTMKWPTALLMVMSAIALALRHKHLAEIVSMAVVAVSLLLLTTGISTTFGDATASNYSVAPDMPSDSALVAFLMMGLSRKLEISTALAWPVVAGYSTVVAISSVVLVGYLSWMPGLWLAHAGSSAMALSTATCLWLLAVWKLRPYAHFYRCKRQLQKART